MEITCNINPRGPNQRTFGKSERFSEGRNSINPYLFPTKGIPVYIAEQKNMPEKDVP
jgi:hypothetical protein